MSRTTRTAGRMTRKAKTRTGPLAEQAGVTLTLRVDLGEAGAVGPGKIRLLELIGETGSISAASRAMGMSYRQAWLLVDSLNNAFREPATTTLSGGAKGGGADLTAFGRSLIRIYRDIESAAAKTVADELAALASFLGSESPTPVRRVKRGSRTKRS